jgi:putative ABC transport system ATP-binding protein
MNSTFEARRCGRVSEMRRGDTPGTPVSTNQRRAAVVASAEALGIVLPPSIDVRGAGRRDPHGGRWLIRDVSLAIEPGRRLAIVGGTGAGKSVLLRAMALLDPLDAGSIAWGGTIVSGDAVPGYRGRVVYLHQRPALFGGNVEENLRVPFRLGAHRHRTFDRARILEQLGRLGRPPEFLERPARSLSGGENQIVGLLRALQLEPAVVLLDEPTASLDRLTTRSVEALLDDWFTAGRGTRSLVWVSHDRDQVGRVSDRQWHMEEGRLSSA